ncbi:MAG TPA: helical backbone metal receptor, partial [Sumerlaeia bacterium]|nr:helical backbone metal receptor [Sumerlaeia bacterium]
PSLTELLFALGLGDRVVGVTRYCDCPEEARTKPKIGGFVDPNYEAIISVKPDLVVMLSSQPESRKRLEGLGVRALAVEHTTVADILASIRIVGEACGKAKEAGKIAADIEKRTARIRGKTRALRRPRVLICIWRDRSGSGKLDDAFVAGRKDFYNELIVLAGGVNAFEDSVVRSPTLSREGFLRVNPEIIVELVDNFEKIGKSREEIIRQWEEIGRVDAVRNKRVYVIKEAYALRPGLRFIALLEDLARILHPEIPWDEKREDKSQ